MRNMETLDTHPNLTLLVITKTANLRASLNIRTARALVWAGAHHLEPIRRFYGSAYF